MYPHVARTDLRRLANYDAMAPVCKEAFDAALGHLEQAVALGFMISLDEAKTTARTNEEEVEMVSRVMEKKEKQYKIVWVKNEGYAPKGI